MAKGKIATRKRARETAFQVLYGLTFSPAQDLAALERAFKNYPQPPDSHEKAPDTAGYAWELVEGIWRHESRLNAIITQYSHNWKMERIGRIEQILLRMAIAEILWSDDVPTRVAISESLELCDHFSNGEAKGFINGILDAVGRAYDAGSLAATEKNNPNHGTDQ